MVDRAPLVLVCVFRPERDHGCWQIRETAARAYPHRHVDLAIEPLSASEGEQLLDRLLLSAPTQGARPAALELPPELRAQILDRGAGNPFYIQQILRALIDEDAIACNDTTCTWQATRAPDEISIPDTLYGVLRSRIDRLPDRARQVLQLAAVIGRIFERRLLAAIADRRSLDEQLVVLERAQLIRERARLPQLTYIFEHQLTLEAAYGGLLRKTRRALHRRTAEALETAYTEQIEPQLGLLAHHWERAGDPARALSYLCRAGEQAAERYANEEAIGYLSRALKLTPESDLLGRYALLLARERIHDLQGHREEQRQDIASLNRIAQELDDGSPAAKRRLAEAALRQANDRNHAFDHAALAQAAQRAVHLLEAVPDAEMKAEAYQQWGTAVLRSKDVEEGRKLWEQALAIARSAGRTAQEAEILRDMAINQPDPSEHATVRAQLERVLEIHREMGNRAEQGRAFNALSEALRRHGDLQAALSCAEQGVDLGRLTGSRREEGYGLGTLALVLYDLGRYAQGLAHLDRALDLLRSVRDPFGEGMILIAQGWGFVYTGQELACLECGRQAIDLGEQFNALMLRIYALDAMGHAWMALGRWHDAAGACAEALALSQTLNYWASVVPSLRANMAELALSSGDLAEARSQVSEILRYAHAHSGLEGTQEPLSTYLTCYRVLRAANDPESWDVLERAYRLVQDRAARIEDQALRRSFLEDVPANREIVAEFPSLQT